MVDLRKRKLLAQHLELFLSGRISNYEFENLLTEDITHGYLPEQYYRYKGIESEDPVLLPMAELSWGLYDDTNKHKLEYDYKLSSHAKEEVKRWILFLNTDLEYSWREYQFLDPIVRFSFLDWLKTIISLGAFYRSKRRAWQNKNAQVISQGNFEFWPFNTNPSKI